MNDVDISKKINAPFNARGGNTGDPAKAKSASIAAEKNKSEYNITFLLTCSSSRLIPNSDNKCDSHGLA